MQAKAIAAALIALFLLSACGTPTPVATPTPTSRPNPTPFPEPEGWTPAATPITLENVREIRQLGRLDAPEPPSTVFAYALSIDNALLAGLNNDFILVWDLQTGDLLVTADRRGANAVMFGPDRQQIYTLSASGEIRVHDAIAGSVVESFGAFEPFNGIWAYDPVGGWLALGSSAGAVQIWDMISRTSLTVLESAEVPLVALSFRPDGRALAQVNQNGTVTVWDFEAGEVLMSTDLLTPVSQIAYAPSGSALVVNSTDGVLMLDPTTGNVAARLTSAQSDGLFSFVGTTDILMFGGEHSDITLWDIFAGALVAALPGTQGQRPSAAAGPEGDMLLASTRSALSLWNLSQAAQGTVLRGNATFPQLDTLRVAWTGDGLQVLVFDTLGPIHVFGIP